MNEEQKIEKIKGRIKQMITNASSSCDEKNQIAFACYLLINAVLKTLIEEIESGEIYND
jgi:hypothetical protein